MSKLPIIGYILLSVVLLIVAAYQSYTFYVYPCEAFKSGYLSIGYAPARCVK